MTDCVVTVHRVRQHAPDTQAGDFRKVAPMVVLRALAEAGTRFHEPCQAVELEVPADTVGDVIGLLVELGAHVGRSEPRGAVRAVEAELPPGSLQRLVAELPGLTRGEGALWTRPGGRLSGARCPAAPSADGRESAGPSGLRFLADRSLPPGR